MTYRTLFVTASAALLFNIGTASAASPTGSADPALEPCLNSEISANGSYAFERKANDPALEPTLNSQVSSGGRFASQAAAQAFAAERG